MVDNSSKQTPEQNPQPSNQAQSAKETQHRQFRLPEINKKLLNLIVIFSGILIFFVIIALGFWFYQDKLTKTLQTTTTTTSPSPSLTNYILEYSEGTCAKDADCIWVGEGCGGGHGTCTNNPKKYEGILSTCDVNPEFPANKGYTCGCISSLGKCGWKK